MNHNSKNLRTIGCATDISPCNTKFDIKCKVLVFTLAFLMLFSSLACWPFSTASALSRPDDALNYDDNIHSTFLASANLYGTGKLQTIGKLPNASAYNTYAPLLTTYEPGNSKNGMIFTSADTNLIYGSLSNRYYDNTNDIDKGRYYYLLQESTATGNYRVTAYQTDYLSFEFSRPTYVYLPKNSIRVDGDLYYYSDILDKIKIWYGVQNSYITLNNLNQNKVEIPTKCVVTMSITGYNALGEIVEYSYTTSTQDNFLYDTSLPYYNHLSANFNDKPYQFSDMLTAIMQYKNVYLVNSLKLDIQLLQDNVKVNYLDITGAETSVDYEDTYNNICYGTIIAEIPTYNENLTYTNNIYNLAHENWLMPHFEDTQSIFAFFGKFMSIELMPGFKISYLLTISFGFILIMIFVRMFR